MTQIPEAPSGDRWLKGIGPLWRGGTQLVGERTAMVSCTRGHVASLSGHIIATDGTVSPSLVCPEAGCDWHVMAKLVGWEP